LPLSNWEKKYASQLITIILEGKVYLTDFLSKVYNNVNKDTENKNINYTVNF
jgi:hypothetical protein